MYTILLLIIPLIPFLPSRADEWQLQQDLAWSQNDPRRTTLRGLPSSYHATSPGLPSPLIGDKTVTLLEWDGLPAADNTVDFSFIDGQRLPWRFDLNPGGTGLARTGYFLYSIRIDPSALKNGPCTDPSVDCSLDFAGVTLSTRKNGTSDVQTLVYSFQSADPLANLRPGEAYDPVPQPYLALKILLGWTVEEHARIAQISNTYRQAPAPFSILAAASAFRMSRSLRRRIRGGAPTAE